MEKTLDLKDNPFDPDLGNGQRLGGDAMLVDDQPQLMKLLCKIVHFEKIEQTLRFALFADSSTGNPRVVGSMILLILGVSGSGRSTMASRICKYVIDAGENGAQKWEKFPLLFDKYQPSDVKAQFATLRSEIDKKFGKEAGRALVLIDDLPAGSFEQVMSAFSAFPRLSRVFVVTSDDPDLKNRDIDAAAMVIERVELQKLTAADVRAMIEAEVPNYRNGKLKKTDPTLVLFPFRDTAPDVAVSNDSKPLRNVRNWLSRSLRDRHRDLVLRGSVDVADAELPDLQQRLIP